MKFHKIWYIMFASCCTYFISLIRPENELQFPKRIGSGPLGKNICISLPSLCSIYVVCNSVRTYLYCIMYTYYPYISSSRSMYLDLPTLVLLSRFNLLTNILNVSFNFMGADKPYNDLTWRDGLQRRQPEQCTVLAEVMQVVQLLQQTTTK